MTRLTKTPAAAGRRPSLRALSLVLGALAATAAAAQQGDQCVAVVSTYWPGHDLSTVQVRVFRDPQRQDLVGAFPAAGPAGKVVLAVPSGTYYLTVVADLDGNGQLGAGDGLGFYGVTDPAAEQPQPVAITEKAVALWIPICLTMGADGKLSPTGVTKPETAAPAPPVEVSGQVSGVAAAGQVVVYAVPGSREGECYAALPAAPGYTFALQLPAGDYYLFAAQDVNDTERLDPGDLVAVHGYSAAQGTTFPTVALREAPGALTLALQWRLSDGGLLKSLDGTAGGPQMAPETVPAVVYGAITGSGGETPPRAALRVCLDAGFRQDAALVTAAAGRFVVALPAGTYFLSAMADQDADGKASAGDLLGFYGVSTLRRGHGPQPLLVGGGELRPLPLLLCARLGADLRPEPIQAAAP